MAGRVEVLERVRVRRIFAASDVATRKTYPKLVPRLSKREAFLASARARRYRLDSAYMFARLGHGWPLMCGSGGRRRKTSSPTKFP
jgi:hypothetical protein